MSKVELQGNVLFIEFVFSVGDFNCGKIKSYIMREDQWDDKW